MAGGALAEGGKQQKPRRFALLLAARDSDYVRKMYGGYYRVFVEAFGEEGAGEERWDLFRVVDGEFPAAGSLEEYDGFVVSGSPHDAYSDELWVLRLCFLLQTLDAMRKRVLGICFGHQVICRALGGRVGKAYGGWDIGIRKVTMVEDLPPRMMLLDDHFGSVLVPTSASIIEIHQDEVWELPIGAEVVAFSDKTGVEVFVIEDHVLGIQGHPEYSKDILCNLVDRLAGANTIESGVAQDLKQGIEDAELDGSFWRRVCRNFLKGR